MHERESEKSAHLLILLVYTALTLLLTVEAVLMLWEPGPIVLLLLALVVSWGAHVTGRIPANSRFWMYFICSMLSCFFYGIHETSIYDLAPLMILIMILFSSSEKQSAVWFCVLTYFFIIGYDLIFVIGHSMQLTVLTVTRLMLHFILVVVSGQLVRYSLIRHERERKQTLNEMKKLREINRRTEDFMANVSHELRTPINAVIGISSILMQNEACARVKKDVYAIRMAGNRLFRQIEDIMDFTEIDTGRVILSEETYMITSLVNDIITEFDSLNPEPGTELVFDVDSRIPAVLYGDEKKIKKILKHLIDNSYKFTREGGIYVRIYALNKPYGINLCIRVSDTGCGMAQEELELITERFYQTNAGRNRKSGGLGLGLPIVYGMVNVLQGFVQIESREGQGTTVSVSIPQKSMDATPAMNIDKSIPRCVACYLNPEKYTVPKVREFYNEMISHLVQGLEISVHRVSNMDEMENLNSTYRLTHLFLGKEEYLQNERYFEKAAESMQVVVVSDDASVVPANSRIKLLRKPFYSLPLIHVLNEDARKTEETPKGGQLTCPGVRALVVDDEPMNLFVARGIFESYGMDVMCAGSGPEAIEICDRNEFDLIFLDHMMPNMDGVETLKLLRKQQKSTQKEGTIIAFTANAVSGARNMFLQEGFDEFISKPVEILELERVLKKVLPKSAIVYVDRKQTIGREQATEEAQLPEEQVPARSEEELLRDSLAESGINMDHGLSYCRNDMDFYRELLFKFTKDFAERETQLEGFLQEENAAEYRIRVHALKSTAKLIGADELSELAKSMEQAAGEGNLAFLREKEEELLQTGREVCGTIRRCLKVEEDTIQLQEITAADLEIQLELLREKLSTFELDEAEELLKALDLTSCDGRSVKSLLADVKTEVENFEFAKAGEKVVRLLEDLKRGEV